MIPLWIHPFLSTLSVLLTLVFVSSILRSERAAGSTLAWLFIICIAPYIGIPIYLFLSGRKSPNRLAGKAKVYKPHALPPGVESWSSTQRLLFAYGVPDAKRNHRIELLPTGEEAYRRVIELIRAAKVSIRITTFIFGNDPVGRSVVEELAKKAASGVEVRILVDSLGATMIRHPSFKAILRAGGRVAYFMPVLHLPLHGRTNLRNHRKLMVVDSATALIGGMNLAQEYLGPTKSEKRWVDLGLILSGGCVADIENIFLKDWAYATHAENVEISSAPEFSQGNGFTAQVVASGPDVSGDTLYDILLSSIHEAKLVISIVTPYFIPDESLEKALELAVKRGVVVRILVPRHSNHRLADLARGSFINQLRAVGADIRYYPRMIHAKAVSIDRKMAILGSANFDMRSLLLNYELGLVIYSEDALGAIEEWLAARNAETVPAEISSGFWRDLADGVGRVIGPIL